MNYLKSVIQEMRKVSWGTKRDLYINTKTVIGFTLLFASLFYVMDELIKHVFQLIIN